MSGHSKWSTIKHKKAKTDAQKGKIFTKHAREITQATKSGGADPDSNARLRLAILKAKEGNMPNDNISRAIQKGSGSGDDSNYEEVTFEAYAPGGVGLLIDTLTDNKNRTVPNLRTALNKHGGSLATKGAVAYQFDQKGLFIFDDPSQEDAIIELATELGAEDLDIKDDGSIEVISLPEHYETLKNAFDAKALHYGSSSITMLPQNTIVIEDENNAKMLLKLIDFLEDDDDVQHVYGNFAFSDEIITILNNDD